MAKAVVYQYRKNYRYRIDIIKSRFLLRLYRRENGGWQSVKEYPVGIGRNKDMLYKIMEGDFRTPEGTYYICQKEELAPGALGTRWLRITYPNRADIKRSFEEGIITPREASLLKHALGKGFFRRLETRAGFGIGIHGTDDPSSIGTCCSEGCIRMHNADVEELYGLVPAGTKVEIRRR